jgi:hypothetical protein
MRPLVRLCVLCVLTLSLVSAAGAQWQCLYVTLDASLNGTGDRTIGVGVIKDNMFVALCMRPNTYCYMIPYVNADSVQGRKYFYGYGTSGIYQIWSDGAFDQVIVNNAFSIKATPDSLIYLASNDIDHNVLVFKYAADTITVVSPFPRQVTGTNSIYGIDVDNNGYVYVCTDSTTGVTQDLKVYSPINTWTPAGHTDAPATTVDLPDGIYKGIAVTPNGDAIFISDYKNRKVIKYTGMPTAGYALDAAFTFSLGPQDTLTGTPPTRTGPIGLGYLSSNNILAVACDSLLKSSGGTNYTYGRIYLLNGNTGSLISADSSVYMIDQAAWNFAISGAYDNQGAGNASGYASTMDAKWDQEGNLYSQSMYGWTVEKWKYNGTLPSFTTGVHNMNGVRPSTYTLNQNYPNPFNPSTTISYALPSAGRTVLTVFDILGNRVASLVDGVQEAGMHSVQFEAQGLASGVYFYQLHSGAFSTTRKLLLLR